MSCRRGTRASVRACGTQSHGRGQRLRHDHLRHAKSPAARPRPLAAAARSHAHSVQITVPAQFDFTLAPLTLDGSATGTHGHRHRINRVSVCRGSRPVRSTTAHMCRGRQPPPTRLVGPNIRVETCNAEPAPAIVPHVDVLADGAPGQDCSSLPHTSAEPPFYRLLRTASLLGSELRPYWEKR